MEEILKLSNFGPDQEEEIKIDSSSAWVCAFIDELEVDVDTQDKNYQRGTLSLDLKVKRKVERPYGDHLAIQVKLTGKYQAACVRCLCLCPQEVDTFFSGCFIPEHFDKDPDYDEVMEIYVDGDAYDLYFHSKGKAKLRNFIHEHLNMNTEPLPLHSENCKGLCTVCGNDLNQKDCGHNAGPQKEV